MSQKYVAVHFFEPQVDGFNFTMSEWPPHITILPRLTLGTSFPQFRVKLQESLRPIQPFELTVGSPDHFGPHQGVPVLLVEPDPTILHAHNSLLQMCVELGCTYDEPAYNGPGYRPHITIQHNNQIQTGQVFTVANLTLVDMYPGEDITRRAIIETYALGT